MFEILATADLAPDIRSLRIRAPKIAARRRPGQFVIVRVSADGERIPLTIVDSDPDEGSISLIVQAVGKTTMLLSSLEPGDALPDVVGPLGTPTRIDDFGTVVTVGGGVGTAIAYPIAVAMATAGNHVIAIFGARDHDHLLLEDELREVCAETYPTTDDGSYGYHGLVTDKLGELIRAGRRIDLVVAIGPVAMMKAVADLTRGDGIETVVSLNPIMIDGTGMCGGCRVVVGDETRFACVDGPEFDGHLVDFDLLARRNRSYLDAERRSVAALDHDERAAAPRPGVCS